MTRFAKTLLASVLAALIFQLALGQDFEIGGQAVYQLFECGDLQRSRTNDFVVTVSGDRWSISTGATGSSNRIHCAYDGEILRTVNANLHRGSNSNSNERWSNVAFIENREVPWLGEPVLQSLWLAYGSSKHLRTATNGRIEPIWMQDNPDSRKQGLRLPATWTLCKSAPFLPRELSYRNEGVYHGFDSAKKLSFTMQLPPPYDQGYVCARYQANALTNFAQAEFPVEFQFTTFPTPLGKGSTPEKPRDTLVARVRTISIPSPNHVFRPAFIGKATVYDYRFQDRLPATAIPDGFVSYKASDGDWPEGAVLETLSSAYVRKLETWRQMERSHTKPSN